MKIYIGSDHAGFRFKQKIKRFLKKKGYNVIDVGNKKLDPKDDYPVFAIKLGKSVVKSKSMGILACGSAQGMCIAANKVKGVRAAIVRNAEEARLSREHNNANVICISGWSKPKNVSNIITTFLKTKFSGVARHRRRVRQIIRFEKKK